jgi:hypothetical protein
VRYLASVNAVPQTPQWPALNLSAGVQGIGTGNPGYSATLEKDWSAGQVAYNAFAGIGLRSNEAHGHVVAGAKAALPGGWSVGLQLDGHDVHPFVTKSLGNYVAGFYLIGAKAPAFMLGTRF